MLPVKVIVKLFPVEKSNDTEPLEDDAIGVNVRLQVAKICEKMCVLFLKI